MNNMKYITIIAVAAFLGLSWESYLNHKCPTVDTTEATYAEAFKAGELYGRTDQNVLWQTAMKIGGVITATTSPTKYE